MSKSIASKKVRYHIPDDLTFSVLSKLPLKSLKRFTRVRKSWSLLFENPNFIKIYGNNFMSRNNEYEEGSSFILQQTQTDIPYFQELYLLSGERLENMMKLDYPHPFQEEEKQVIYILGSVINGVVCLYQGRGPRVVLWNPATQESKLLPSSPTESPVYQEEGYFNYHGFGYDYVTRDYKVIRYVSYLFCLTDSQNDTTDFQNDTGGMLPNAPDDTWEVYSLRNNSWKKLDLNMFSGSHSHVGAFVYLKGACHWYDEGWFREGEYKNKAYLVSFDLSNEIFCTTSMPSDMNDSSDVVFWRRYLLVLNDHIAFISYYVDTTTFHISILGELGVKESWTKIFVLGPLPCIEEPIGMGVNGDLFFRRKDDELVWFNLSTQMIKELGFKGKLLSCHIVIYKESLLRIGQIND
ncbi:F-box/kelch-repeat protein At3g06240-like [Vicia villosa]|uniref:F-box/kelch-repeat protein At3g06240-like n=1 Tax=Vicia villosa TaxID=3911 RepID=UPI00273BE2B0|nr:F-box/kelch-repeat protein At3g06240-like [Vicia villosa]